MRALIERWRQFRQVGRLVGMSTLDVANLSAAANILHREVEKQRETDPTVNCVFTDFPDWEDDGSGWTLSFMPTERHRAREAALKRG